MKPGALFQRAHDVDANQRHRFNIANALWAVDGRGVGTRMPFHATSIAHGPLVKPGSGSLLIEAIRAPFAGSGKAQDARAEVRSEDSGGERVGESGTGQDTARVELLGGPFDRAAPGQRDLSRERV